MRALWLAAVALFCASAAFGQTAIVGDAVASGRLGVGGAPTNARVQVQMSSAATTAFQVSGVDETPFLTVANSGAVGLGVTPAANLDISGSGDSGAIGLQLRNGNLYPATSAMQLAFGYNGTTNLSHAIATFHSTTSANNGMSFYFWSPAVSTTAIGTKDVLSLITTSTSGYVSVLPPPVIVSSNIVELVISDGSAFGGGTIDRILATTHSSRELKTDIAYMTQADEDQALADVATLKPVRFRYMSVQRGKLKRDKHQPLRRGLLYEDAPASVKGPGAMISVDDRLTNAELAMQALMRRLDQTQKDAASLGGKP